MKISNLTTLHTLSMRMPTLKIKLIMMADGLYLYKTDEGYVVLNELGFILKSAKTIKTCDNFIQKTLHQRRADEKIN